jgi:hypothetical protein
MSSEDTIEPSEHVVDSVEDKIEIDGSKNQILGEVSPTEDHVLSESTVDLSKVHINYQENLYPDFKPLEALSHEESQYLLRRLGSRNLTSDTLFEKQQMTGENLMLIRNEIDLKDIGVSGPKDRLKRIMRNLVHFQRAGVPIELIDPSADFRESTVVPYYGNGTPYWQRTNIEPAARYATCFDDCVCGDCSDCATCLGWSLICLAYPNFCCFCLVVCGDICRRDRRL